MAADVNEHLSDAAKAIYGSDGDLHKEWAHQRCTELKAGRIDAILAALALHASIKEAQECSEYIRRNRHRMRYDEFHAAGLCTLSAVVESGCELAIGLRLKPGGMFWTVNGANAIIALRCSRLSGRFEDFWEHRATRRAS